MAKYSSQTTKIYYEDPGSTWNQIGQVNTIAGPGGTASIIDVTDLDSTAIEKLAGLPDEGQVTLDIIFDPGDSAHQYLINARKARTTETFKIELPTTATNELEFDGLVLGFELSGAVDEALTASVTIEVTGQVTWTFGT